MRFTGSAVTGICICFLAACFVFPAPSAQALSVETPVVGIDIGADEGGVDVGVSLPAVGTDAEANVGVGEEGVSVDTDVESTPAPAGSEGGAADETPAQSTQRPETKTSSSQPRSEDAASEAPSSGKRDEEEPTTSLGERQNTGSASSRSAGETSPDSGGLAGLVAAQFEPASSRAASPETTSVVAQLVEYIPTWLWIALIGLLAALLATAAYAVHERRNRKAADRLALLDPLTGIANVKSFEQRLGEEWARTTRYGGELGVLMVDLDRFKAVNDKHGHAVGDKVLIATAEQLLTQTRDTDFVARIGGDEFAVICPHTELEGLRTLRRHLESELPRAIGFGIGVSIGAADLSTLDKLPSEMIARADAEMYEQKASHRGERGSDRSMAEAV